MFLNAPKNPTRMKHVVYLTASTLLGVILSFVAHALIEMTYINYALAQGIVLTNTGIFRHAYCVLPQWLQLALLVGGILAGFHTGRYFWRKVYIERV